MTGTTSPAPAWICPVCRTGLVADTELWACPGCAAMYPCLRGLPILVRDPARFLAATALRVRSTVKAARERVELLRSIASGQLLEESLERLRQVGDAQLANARVFEALMRPIESWLARAIEAGAPANSGGGEASLGWDATALIPFLIRDWRCDQELDATAGVISDALGRHLGEATGGTLAMLGCGGGGLVGRLSARFSRAIGLELSVPALMAVRSLQDGDTLAVHYPSSTPTGARMQELRLQAGPEALRAVTFAAGDASLTPLAAGSVDCVATCFLLDVVEDPPAVAREIHRILSDQGTWVNYGPSGGMSALWRFDETELAAFLKFTGFSVLETARHRTTHLDLRQIDEWTHYHSHTCYLSVARKQSRGVIPAQASRTSARISSATE